MTINPLDHIVKKPLDYIQEDPQKDKIALKMHLARHEPTNVEWVYGYGEGVKPKKKTKKTYNVKIIGNIYDSKPT